MAGQTRVQRVLLQYEVDDKALGATLRANDRVRTELTKLQGEADKTTLTSARLQGALGNLARERRIDQIGRDFARAAIDANTLEVATEKAVAELTRLGATEAEIRRVARAYDDLAEAAALDVADPARTIARGGTSRNPFGRQRGNLGVIGQQLFLLPDPQNMPFTEISRGLILVDAALQAMGGSVTALLPQMALVTAVLVAGGLAAREFSRRGSEVTAGLKAITDRTEEYFQLLSSGTLEQVQAAIRLKEAERDAAQARIDSLAFVPAGYEDLRSRTSLVFGQIATGLTEIGGVLGVGGLNEIRDARVAYDEAQEALSKANAELDNLNALLGETDVQARSAALALKTYLVELGTHQAEVIRNDIIQRREWARSTVEANNQLAQSFQDEIDATTVARNALDEYIDALEGSIPNELLDQLDTYDASIRELQKDLAALNLITDGYVAGLEAEAKFKEDLVAKTEELVKAQEALTKAGEALIEEEDRNIRALFEIRRDLAFRLEDIEYKTGQRRAEILEKAELDAAKVREKAADDQRRAEEKLRRDLLKIQNQYNNAVAERDALAAFLAMQKADETRRDADAEARDRRENERRRLAEIRAAADRELRQLAEQNRRELELAHRAANEAIRIENEKYTREIQVRQQAYNIALQQYQMFLQQLQAIGQAHGQRQFLIPSSTGIISNQEARDRGFLPQYHNGAWDLPRDHVARVGAHEMILPALIANAVRGMANSPSLTIQLDGQTLRATSRHEAMGYVNDFLKSVLEPR